MADLKALIEKQRAKNAVAKESVLEVEFGDEKISVGIVKASPEEWDDLVGSHPPRPGNAGDGMVGYNQAAVSAAYPHVTVDGEDVDSAVWAETFSLLDPVWRNSIGVTVWGVNINESLLALSALGKASAGRKSPSPAN